MLTVVVDRSITGNTYFYYNATLIDTRYQGISNLKSFYNIEDFYVGESKKSSSKFFIGCIDDLKIYNGLLDNN